MKSRLITLGISVTLLCIAFSFHSCKKETADNDTSVALDNFTAENESDRLVDGVNSVAVDSGVNRLEEGAGTNFSVLPGCAHVLLQRIDRRMTIFFDSTGSGCLCSGWDGKYRKGVIVVTWTGGGYFVPGSTITINTYNYYVNDNRFDFTKTVTNKGLNSAGHLNWDINVSKALITFKDGKTINWTSQRNREQIDGGTTPRIVLDDVYSITGTAEGTGRNGIHFTSTITNPLIVAVGCPWIKQGTIEITPDSKATRTLDFGSGACDSEATVEIKGVLYNINL